MARVNVAGRWSETRGRREKVLLHHLQSLYRTECDRRAQFNEAVFLVFSPPSPQMALLLFLLILLFLLFLLPLLPPPLPCTLPSRLCAYLPFSYLLTCVSSLTAHFLLPPPPRISSLPPSLPPASNISALLSLSKVDYRTEDGTANAGSDYEFAEGTLLFKPGETLKGINISHGQNIMNKTCH